MIAPTTNPRRNAFTLVELLIAIVVIVILASLVFIAGTAVTQRQRVRVTENLLITLDRVLDVYMLERGALPPYNPDDYIGTPGESNGLTSLQGVIGNHPARPDAAVFLAQATGYGEVDDIIQSIPNDFVRRRQFNNQVIGADMPSIVDSWAQPGWPEDPNNPTRPFPVDYQQVIYFVHPQNTVAQALFGRCRNDRPYFMSAGPDRTYGFINEPNNNIEIIADSDTGDFVRKLVQDALDDNIYSTTVDPPVIPANFDSNEASLRTWSPR